MQAPLAAARSSLTVRNALTELSGVSRWVGEWARQHRLPGALAQILDLCTAEVVTNIINYAYDDDALHRINLHLLIREDLISLEIEDDGRPFDPVANAAHPQRPNLEEGRVGGWGIRIVAHFAEDLRYRRADASNQLTITFRNPDGYRADS